MTSISLCFIFGRAVTVWRSLEVNIEIERTLMKQNSQKLSLSIHLAYGVGSMGTGLFSAVPGLLLLYFMTDTLGISAGLAGLAVFIPKIWDVVTDPVMGTISDRTRSAWGRRRPYLLAGALTLPVCFALLFMVPGFESSTARFFYILVMFILCATAYTLFQVPYIAMPAEMTQNYHERTTIMSFRMVFMTLGILAGGGLAPIIIDMAGGGRPGYAAMSITLALICFVVMLLTFWGTRKAPYLDYIETTLPFKTQMTIAFQNRPFIVLLIGYFPQQIAVGSILATLPFFVKYILHAPEMVLTICFVSLVLPAVVTMPVWVWISRKTGKKKAFLISSSLFAVMALSLLTGSADHLQRLYVQIAVMGTAYAGIQLFPFSMLPDTIQLDFTNSGMRREGIFTGVWTAAEKTGIAIGALASGSILSAFGFVETVAGEMAVQSPETLTGILLAFSVAPVVLFLVSLPVINRYHLPQEALDAAGSEKTEPS